jgi:ERCC4-type nuclease
MPRTPAEFIQSPFTVAIDTREQFPFTFQGLKADADKRNKPILIPTEIVTIRSGDYSIIGYQNRIAIERKSLSDLYGTIGGSRERFENELARLNELEFAAVVIEAGWSSIVCDPPPKSKLNPKIVYRSIISWQQRFLRVHWWDCPTRSFAERTTYRMLHRFWKADQKAKKQGVEDALSLL